MQQNVEYVIDGGGNSDLVINQRAGMFDVIRAPAEENGLELLQSKKSGCLLPDCCRST
jgi:hypothetical protein